MKFAKPLFLVGLSLCLFACNTTPNKDTSVATDPELGLLSSAQYIPVIIRDKEGIPKVYVASDDPYSSQKGRVNKKAILQFIEAKRAFNSGDYSQAEKHAKAIIDEFEGLSGPWVMLGDIAVKAGLLEDAELHYANAIRVNEQNINAYLKLALTQRQQGKYLLAQNTYVNALQQWPDFPEAHLNLAVLYDVYLNHPIRAQRHFEAYQFLTNGRDVTASRWLSEVKNRTGLAYGLKVGDDRVAESALNE